MVKGKNKGVAPAFKKVAAERAEQSRPTQAMKLDAVAKTKKKMHQK